MAVIAQKIVSQAQIASTVLSMSMPRSCKYEKCVAAAMRQQLSDKALFAICAALNAGAKPDVLRKAVAKMSDEALAKMVAQPECFEVFAAAMQQITRKQRTQEQNDAAARSDDSEEEQELAREVAAERRHWFAAEMTKLVSAKK